MSLKKKIGTTFQGMLQRDFNIYKQKGMFNDKVRKYEHMDIQKEFKVLDEQRKAEKLRLVLLQKQDQLELIQKQIHYYQVKEKLLTDDKHLSEEEKQQIESDKQKLVNLEDFVRSQNSQNFDEYQSKNKFQKLEYQNELILQKQDLNYQISEIQKLQSTIDVREEVIDQLDPDYILLEGNEKQIVLCQVECLNFYTRNIGGFHIHPTTKNALENIYYFVTHNMPVEKILLYETMPDLFTTEISTMNAIKKQELANKHILNVDFESEEKVQLNFFQKKNYQFLTDFEVKDDIVAQYELEEWTMQLHNFYCEQQFEIKWKGYIQDKMKSGRFADEDQVFDYVWLSDENKLTEKELQMKKEMQQQLQQIEDLFELRDLQWKRYLEFQKQLIMPVWVENHPVLRAAAIKMHEEQMKAFRPLDETIWLPQEDPEEEEELPSLEEANAKGKQIDMDYLIKQSNQEYVDNLGGQENIRERLHEKDPKLVKNLQIMTELHHQAEQLLEEQIEERLIPKYINDESKTSVIQLHEYTKLLYLNNKDPKLYDLTYWAEYFNIAPTKLRNIFNMVAYGIHDVESDDTGRVLRFIYYNENQIE